MESASVEELSPLFFENLLRNDFDNCIDIGSFLELAVGADLKGVSLSRINSYVTECRSEKTLFAIL